MLKTKCVTVAESHIPSYCKSNFRECEPKEETNYENAAIERNSSGRGGGVQTILRCRDMSQNK